MTIGARIDECIRKISQGDAENAFIQLAIAIDGTAKRLYPGQRTTDRCKRFLSENLSFVFWSLTNGTPNQIRCFPFNLSDENSPKCNTKFEDLVYSILRCALLHEGEMPKKVVFIPDSYIGTLDGKIQFPIALVGALLLAVVASPVNAREKVSPLTEITFGSTKVRVCDFLGDLERTKSAIRLGFQYDVEKLVKNAASNTPGSSE